MLYRAALSDLSFLNFGLYIIQLIAKIAIHYQPKHDKTFIKLQCKSVDCDSDFVEVFRPRKIDKLEDIQNSSSRFPYKKVYI